MMIIVFYRKAGWAKEEHPAFRVVRGNYG